MTHCWFVVCSRVTGTPSQRSDTDLCHFLAFAPDSSLLLLIKLCESQNNNMTITCCDAAETRRLVLASFLPRLAARQGHGADIRNFSRPYRCVDTSEVAQLQFFYGIVIAALYGANDFGHPVTVERSGNKQPVTLFMTTFARTVDEWLASEQALDMERHSLSKLLEALPQCGLGEIGGVTGCAEVL